MTRIYVYVALLASVLALLGYGAHKTYQAGYAASEAKHAVAATKAADEVSRREQASAEASGSMLDYLAANLPQVETKTHEAIERVRIVYRDRPVPAVCEWPDSVLSELNQARDRANAAGEL